MKGENVNDWPTCEVCGVPGDRATITMDFSKDFTTSYCDFCAGLVEAGLIRPEKVDGELRYRQWHMGEWTPGELVPKVVMPS